MPLQVPTIDLVALSSSRKESVAKLLQAASEAGFFYVEGHGISEKVVDRTFSAGEQFRALSGAAKSRYRFVPDRYLGWWGFKLAKLLLEAGTSV